MLIAHHYHSHPHGDAPLDRVVLDYNARFLRRKVLITENGTRLLVDLPHATSLEDGGVLITVTQREVLVVAAREPVLDIMGDNLARLAWHIGNRHTPCQILPDRLRIQRDPVIRHMLETLGAHVAETEAVFTPEGGAYGHGRTHAHEHGATAHAH